ncbi:MAG TPA: DUF4998 domain-containing protein [Bacteroidales bacterium]|nr:DUF4998 domain-containing protein [Bacteroidales bacterium]
MKKINFLLVNLFVLMLVSCDKMGDNFKQYLETEHVYAPKVSNLSASERLREATLYWDNPDGDIAKKIFIDYEDDSLLIDQMVDSAVITNLEIKGYTVSVYTIDAFDHRSVPVSITVFPNGEN